MSWNESTMTIAGVELLMGALSGRTLTIVSAVGGVGTDNSADLPAMTDVTNPMQNLKLRGMRDYDTHKMIYIQIGNDDLVAGYTLNQIGVFAQLDDEEPRLLFIMQDTKGIYIPAESENPDFLFEMHADIAVSREAEIKLNISTGIVVSVDFMMESIAAALQEHNDDDTAHGNLSSAAEMAQLTAEQALDAAKNAHSAANAAAAAAEEAKDHATVLVTEHNNATDAHADIRKSVGDINGRLQLYELKNNTNVTGNSFSVLFDTLNELIVTGVWNKVLARVEF